MLYDDEIRKTFVLHIPHSSTVVPFNNFTDQEALQEEIIRNTDIATDRIFDVGIDAIICPWSRVFCDVERFENDPLEDIGQGFYYIKDSNGKPFRNEDEYKSIMLDYYRSHHSLFSAIAQKKIDEHEYVEW